jgi:hypothetical protein
LVLGEKPSTVGVGSDHGRENLAFSLGSIGTQHPHLIQTTARRKGRREIKPTWPQMHLRRTSMHWLYPGGVYSVNVTGGAAPHASSLSLAPVVFEPAWCKRSVPRRRIDRSMAEPRLEGPGIVAGVRQGKAARVSETSN